MDAHILNMLQRLSICQRIVVRSHHPAHVIGLFESKFVSLATASEVTALLAPECAGVVPLEGLLATGIAHAAIIVSNVSESS